MPIFTDEPTDLKPNTVVSVPVGKSTKVSSPTEPTVTVQNRDSERQFRTQEEMKTSLLFDKDTPLLVKLIDGGISGNQKRSCKTEGESRKRTAGKIS